MNIPLDAETHATPTGGVELLVRPPLSARLPPRIVAVSVGGKTEPAALVVVAAESVLFTARFLASPSLVDTFKGRQDRLLREA